MLTRIKRLVCGWRGHNWVMRHDRRSQWLECVSCLHRSPGWDRTPNRALLRSLRFQRRLATERDRRIHKSTAYVDSIEVPVETKHLQVGSKVKLYGH